MGEVLKFTAYHGTYKSYAVNILRVGFYISNQNNDWLGKGVYFFEEDCNNAKKWAYRKWNKEKRPSEKYAVLKSEIEANSQYVLDLTDQTQCKYFAKMREEYQKRNARTFQFNLKDVELDCLIMNKLCEKTRIDVAKKLDFIRFPKEVRLKIYSRIPNCVIICVKNRDCCIKNTTIIDEGEFDVRSKEYL
ncbi:MAG: hypothetical protein ACFWUC_13095 [Oscillospiraceae bacterium]|jgi:hypothetical protein